MERSVDYSNLQLIQRISGQYTVSHCRSKTFLDRRDEFFGDITSFDFIDKLQSAFKIRICRFYTNNNISKLTTSTRLFFINFTKFNRLSNSLFIRHLRTTLITFDFKLTFQTVDNNIKMKFTHTTNNRLACFLIRLNSKGWILFCQFLQTETKFIHILLSLRLNSNTDNRIREIHRFKNNRSIFCT